MQCLPFPSSIHRHLWLALVAVVCVLAVAEGARAARPGLHPAHPLARRGRALAQADNCDAPGYTLVCNAGGYLGCRLSRAYPAGTTADELPTLPGMGPQLKCYYTAPGKEKLGVDLSTLTLASNLQCPGSTPAVAAPDQTFCDSCGRCAKVPIIAVCHYYYDTPFLQCSGASGVVCQPGTNITPETFGCEADLDGTTILINGKASIPCPSATGQSVPVVLSAKVESTGCLTAYPGPLGFIHYCSSSDDQVLF